MGMSVLVMTPGRVHAPEIDEQSNRRDEQKLICFHFRRVVPDFRFSDFYQAHGYQLTLSELPRR